MGTCPNCGLDPTGPAPHSCLAAERSQHPAGCICIYCELEVRFAAWPELTLDSVREFMSSLAALIVEWDLVDGEYRTASFERREELVEVLKTLEARLAQYLDCREMRKQLQRSCRLSLQLRDEFGRVCDRLVWRDDFERAMRLG